MELPDVRSGDTRKLAEMLSLSDDAKSDEPWKSDDIAAILRHQLALPYAGDLDGTSASTVGPGAVAGTKIDSPTASFAELFLSPAPLVESLRRVKDFAKATANDTEFPLPRDVATVLYFASIAVALVRCGERITGLTDSAIQDGFTWAAGQPGVPEGLRAVFHEALQRRESGSRPS